MATQSAPQAGHPVPRDRGDDSATTPASAATAPPPVLFRDLASI